MKFTYNVKFLTVLSVSSFFIYALHASGFGKKAKAAEIIKVASDKPTSYGSLSENYIANYMRDTAELNQLNFELAHVPTLDNEEEIRERFQSLNQQAVIPLQYNNTVKGFMNLYLVRKRLLSSKIIGRSYDYFPTIERILKENNMPVELKNLAVVESALNGDARSWCGALGIWQFMPATARLYSLSVNQQVDERLNLELSTVAAIKYLNDLHGRFGDWLLAIAAYNCGPGNVSKAIRRSGGSRDFWKIMKYMPRETQGYVPAFVAVCYMMENYEKHNLKAIDPLYMNATAVPVELCADVKFRDLAPQFNMTPEELAFFNTAYDKKGGIQVSTDSVTHINLPTFLVEKYLSMHHSDTAPALVNATK